MKKKSNRSTLILIAVFLVGLSLLLYPSISNYWNSFHATRAIASYSESVQALDESQYEQMLAEARAYNQALLAKPNRYHMTEPQRAEYEAVLDISGTGIMGYIEIPSLRVSLPVYHGTDEGVLQVAVGHIEGSSLPVGGESTHCVVSGHRGLPSAKLFTDLDKMKEDARNKLHQEEGDRNHEKQRDDRRQQAFTAAPWSPVPPTVSTPIGCWSRATASRISRTITSMSPLRQCPSIPSWWLLWWLFPFC